MDIVGATASSYRLRAADLEATLRVVVTATNVDGSTDATSLATAVVSAGGGYPAALLDTAGLAHYWRLGEASGTSLSDVKGARDATASGLTFGVSGALSGDANTAARFNGSSSVASAPVDLSGTSQLTVEFWLKVASFTNEDGLAMEFTPNYNGHDGGFVVDPNDYGGKFAVGLGRGDSRNTVYFDRPSAGAWHHYAFVMDTTASGATQIIPYVDGQAVSYTKGVSGTGAGTFADSTLFFMSRNASSLLGAGDLDELALYSDTLSASEVADHYAVGLVNEEPVAAFSASPSAPIVDQAVRLNASDSDDADGDVAQYEWDFNGDSTYDATTATPVTTHAYSTTGARTVRLRVTDDRGATDTITHVVTVGAGPSEPYPAGVLGTSGLAHYWRLGDSSGNELKDLRGASPAAATAVTLGVTGALSGDANTAARFNGSSSVASAPVDLSGTSQLTVEFWLKVASFTNDDGLAMEFTPNYNGHDGGFVVDPNDYGGKFAVGLGRGDSRNTVYFDRPSAGAWHHYAFAMDTTASGATQIVPYVDGAAVSYTKGVSGTGAGTFADSTLYFMSRNASSLLGAGDLDDLAIYTSSLTAGQVAGHYANAAGNQDPTADLTATPTNAIVGQTVTFDASDSADADGSIEQYEWDLDGDGTYGAPTSSAVVTHAYANAGSITARVRVSDDDDATAVANQAITITAGPTARYPRAVLDTTGLAHYWRLGESTGTALADVRGSQTATANAVTLGQTGALLGDSDTAAAFNGTSSAASAQVDLSDTSQLTIEFWLKVAAYNNDDGLAMELTPNFNAHDGGFVVDPNDYGGKFAVGLGRGGSRNNVYFDRPSAGAWHHYAFVLDTTAPAATQIVPYIDGQPVAYTKGDSGTGAGDFANSTLHLMSRNGDALHGTGLLDDVALYTDAVSATEIARHYEKGAASGPANTALPAVAGAARVGEELEAESGDWDAAGPIEYVYQWLRCDGEGANCISISGADEAVYAPLAEDVRARLRVRVTATDENGSTSAESAATDAVEPDPSRGPVAALAFDETTGPTAQDATGHGHDGNVTGAAWAPAGRHGGALSFDGVDDEVSIPASTDLDLTEGMTLEAWVKPNSLQALQSVIRRDVLSGPAYALYATGEQDAKPNGEIDDQSVTSDSAIATGEWQHLALTYQGKTMRLYLDGALVGEQIDVPAPPVGAGPLQIGATGTLPAEGFDGLIDEVRIYDRALDADEIRQDALDPINPPQITVAGSLLESADEWLSNGSYDLEVQATAATASTGLSQLEISIDGDLVATEPACAGPACSIVHELTFTPGDYEDGDHEVAITAVDNAGGTTRRSILAHVDHGAPSVPDRPTIDSDHGVRISWRDVADRDVHRYHIYRRVGAGSFQLLTVDEPVQSPFEDATAQPGQTLSYQLRAVDDADNASDPSGPATIVVDDPARPAPNGPRAESAPEAVIVSWDPQAATSGYELYRRLSTEDPWEQINVEPISATEYVDETVDLDSTYAYIVRSVDQDGRLSQISTEVHASAGASTDVVPQIDLSGTLVDAQDDPLSGSYTLQINASEGTTAHPAAGITDLEVFIDEESVERWSQECAAGNCTMQQQITLDTADLNDGPHSVEVIATDARDRGASQIVNVMADDGAPPAVQGLRGFSEWGTTDLRWNAINEPDLAGYEVLRADGHTGDFEPLTTYLTSNTSLSDDAGVSTVVRYKVVAVDAAGHRSADSQIVTIDTEATLASPDNLEATSDPDAVNLSWEAVTGASGYLVYRDDDVENDVQITPEPISQAAFLDSDVNTGETYYYVVRAVSADGRLSDTSNYVDVTVPLRSEQPALVLSGSLYEGRNGPLTNSSYQLTIDASEPTGPGITSVEVRVNEETRLHQEQPCQNGGCSLGAAFTLNTDEYPDGDYDLEVVARDAEGETATTELTIIIDRRAPGRVEEFKAVEEGLTAHLSWVPNSDRDLHEYKLYRAAGTGEPTLIATAAAGQSTYVDAALTLGETYHYSIKARDHGGQLSAAEESAVTIGGASAAVPTGLSATPGIYQVSLAWNPIAADDLAGYHVYRRVNDSDPWERLTTGPTKSAAYVDETAPAEAAATYLVRAISEAGRQGPPSVTVTATAETLGTPPQRPFLFSHTTAQNVAATYFKLGDDRPEGASLASVCAGCDTRVDRAALSGDGTKAAIWNGDGLVLVDLTNNDETMLCLDAGTTGFPGVPDCLVSELAYGTQGVMVAFSPISSKIVYAVDGRVYQIATSGGDPQVLRDDLFVRGARIKGGFAADGRLFISGATEYRPYEGPNAWQGCKTFVLTPNVSATQEIEVPESITSGGNSAADCYYDALPTPAGDALIIAAADNADLLYPGAPKVQYVPLDGGPIRALTPSLYWTTGVSVSPDGARFSVSGVPGPFVSAQIYSIGLDALDRRVIAGSTTQPPSASTYAQATDTLSVSVDLSAGDAFRGDDEFEVSAHVSTVGHPVSDVSLLVGGQRVDGDVDTNGDATLEASAPSLSEGRHTARVVARTTAGTERMVRAQFFVDDTKPEAPKDLSLKSLDDDTAEISWSAPLDPDLADGTEGTGVTNTSYRYRRISGSWSDWVQTSTRSFTAASATLAGEVELRLKDRAGNTTTVRRLATHRVMVSATRCPGGRCSAGNARAAAGATQKGVPTVNCFYGGTYPTLLEEFHGETYIAVEATQDAFCIPAPAKDPAQVAINLESYRDSTVTAFVCLQIDDNKEFTSPKNLKCEMNGKKRAKIWDKLNLRVRQLCTAGTHYYRTTLRGVVSTKGSKPGVQEVEYAPFRHPCNAAGAWRRVANREADGAPSRTPSKILGENLMSDSAGIDRDPLPRGLEGGRRGWEAHHIVPADDGRGTNRLDAAVRAVQAYAYACNLEPNSAVNGVWLRGAKLADGTTAFRELLTSSGRKRFRHSALHNARHFEWLLRKQLAQHATSQGTCLSPGGMKASLRRVRAILVNGGHAQD